MSIELFEPRSEKTGLVGFRTGATQLGLYSQRSKLEAWYFGFNKRRDCTIRVAKIKALISYLCFRICKNPAFLLCGYFFLEQSNLIRKPVPLVSVAMLSKWLNLIVKNKKSPLPTNAKT